MTLLKNIFESSSTKNFYPVIIKQSNAVEKVFSFMRVDTKHIVSILLLPQKFYKLLVKSNPIRL